MKRVLLVLAFVVGGASLVQHLPPTSAVLLTNSSEGQVQQFGSLSGQVVDRTGAALPGVEVTVTSEVVGTLSRSTVTDAAGRFSFPDLPPGSYRVEYRLSGFSSNATRATVAVGQVQEMTLRLDGGFTSAPPPPAAGGPPPSPKPVPRNGGTPRGGEPPPPGLAVVPVFYATDRARLAETPLNYGTARNPGGTLFLGRFDVSIPRDHRQGQIERPRIWTFEREDPNKHLVIVNRRQQSYDEFYKEVRGFVDQSAQKEAFVFIHGFNVGFEGAVFRTAQIAYDLGFDGAPILYSWPSAESVVNYTTDAANNDWTVTHLRWFLEDVATRSGAARVHLIAHSMGNKALVNALDRMPRTNTKKFAQIVLTAPDIDADTFVQLADAVRRNGQMATLYASANDVALLASKKLQTYRRAGDTSGGVVVVSGIDTIDVSAVDTNLVGHFYYGDNTSVISDMFLVLSQALPPPKRPRLRSAGTPASQYWRFVP